MKKLIEIIKANYDLYVDAFERIQGDGNTQYQKQIKVKGNKCSKVIPFISKSGSFKNE